MAFTKGTASFTNGSKTVTSVSLTSGQLAYFGSGTAVFVQSEGQLIEATGLPKDGNGDVIPNQFLLRDDWTGPTGSYDFVAFDTIEGLRDAVQSARGFSQQLQDIFNSVSVAPNADSVAKRTNDGRTKTANANDPDDAVALGQTGTVLGRDVGTGSGEVAEYTASGLSGLGYGATAAPNLDNLDVKSLPNAFYSVSGAATGRPPGITGGGSLLTQYSNVGGGVASQIYISGDANDEPEGIPRVFVRRYVNGTLSWTSWYELPQMGLGSVGIDTDSNPINQDLLDFNNLGLATGFYTAKSSAANSPNWSGGEMLQIKRSSSLISQLAFDVTDNDVYSRSYNASAGGWTTWKKTAFNGDNVSFSSLNVSGSKNFRIDNPANPDEYLYHSAIESDKPRTQYVLEIDVDSTLEATHIMPDWFHGLNGNTCTVFCSPCKHFGDAYGEVTDGVLTLSANTEGRYHVLIIAERSDNNIADWVLTEPKPTKEGLEE